MVKLAPFRFLRFFRCSCCFIWDDDAPCTAQLTAFPAASFAGTANGKPQQVSPRVALVREEVQALLALCGKKEEEALMLGWRLTATGLIAPPSHWERAEHDAVL